MSERDNNIIIYNTPDGKASVALYAKDGSVWMNQSQLAELFDTSKQNIGQHIKGILDDRELSEDSVVKNYFKTATDGKHYKITFYALDMILANQDKKILRYAGSISNTEMEQQVRKIYEQFDQWRKTAEAQQADEADLEELKRLEEEVKKKN